MRQFFKLILAFAFCFNLFAVPQTILFIGNSYFYYNDSLHNHLRRMLEEKYPEMKFTFKSSTISAARLHHHNFDHLIDNKNLGVETRYDLVIMQAGSFEFSSSSLKNKYLATVKENVSKAEKKDIKTALYMFHDYLPYERRFREDNYEDIVETHRKAARENNSLLLPIAIAFTRAYEEKPDIKLHHIDGSHPSLLGHYLAAYTLFAFLTDSSPIGLKYNYLGKVSEEDAYFLQKIAWDTYNQEKKLTPKK